jgi:hypothetical protein
MKNKEKLAKASNNKQKQATTRERMPNGRIFETSI